MTPTVLVYANLSAAGRATITYLPIGIWAVTTYFVPRPQMPWSTR